MSSLQPEESPVVLDSTPRPHTRLLQFNRPQKRNALSQALITSLLRHLSSADQDPDVHVIVITGAGSLFSAGADIKEISQLDANEARRTRYLEDLCHGMSRVRKPLIAAVESMALGGGFELALMCDIIVASQDARFGFPEVNIGLLPGAGGTQRLASLVGQYRAMQMVLTGEPIPASQAKEYGILSSLSEQGASQHDALDLAALIAGKSQTAVSLSKEAIKRAVGLGHDLEYERSLYYSAFGTADKEEGIQAFLDKRKPVWKQNN
ncbi:hypothetical protein FQN54_008074 [Arachnomyces sp. PD_36]|nr:hypothetical protein FQN54_008074 [Arachnomyces sp. PD_36]